MDVLAKIRLPTKKRPLHKKPAKKKIHEDALNVSICKFPKPMIVKAYIKDNSYASYADGYFPKYLCEFKKKHIDLMGVNPDKYTCKFDEKGFYFSSSKRYLQCKDVNGKILPPKDYIGRKATLQLRVKPYEFKATGMNIQVISVLVH